MPTKNPDSTAPLIRSPEGGTPPLVTSIQGILEWCAKVGEDEPLAIDVERASSYRYSAKAYLVQVKTEAAGILLFDPLAFTIPLSFTELMNSHPWILHAARQDLPSLAMLGFEPCVLFDTEVAARLLGIQRVGLGGLIEDLLGIRLAKEHSAANWSKRPLPASWLDYAALDVEFLLPLKVELQSRLEAAHKAEWAREEFEFESSFSRVAEQAEPWRSLHGIGQLRHPKELAVARALWEYRDSIAQRADIAPFMVMRDKFLVAMAKNASRGRTEFEKALPREIKHRDQWWKVARSGRQLSAAHLPSISDGAPFPSHKTWSRKSPEASEVYQAIRTHLLERAEDLHMPVENLISPGHMRHWVWNHFGDESCEATGVAEGEISSELHQLGARGWQAKIVSVVVRDALAKRHAKPKA